MNVILEINDNFKTKVQIPAKTIKWIIPMKLFSINHDKHKTIYLEFMDSGREVVEEETHIYNDGVKEIKEVIKTLYRIFELVDASVEEFISNFEGIIDEYKK